MLAAFSLHWHCCCRWEGRGVLLLQHQLLPLQSLVLLLQLLLLLLLL